jgi:hypothetical protein
MRKSAPCAFEESSSNGNRAVALDDSLFAAALLSLLAPETPVPGYGPAGKRLPDPLLSRFH